MGTGHFNKMGEELVRMKAWWFSNLIIAIIFGLMTVFLMIRRVDGAGAIQTPGAKLASLMVLGVVFLFVVFIQLMVLFGIQRRKPKRP